MTLTPRTPRGRNSISVSSPTNNVNANCSYSFRSFVRVRPYKYEERNIVAPEQIVVRPCLHYDPSIKMVTVLDPAAKFRPRKGGNFFASNMLWSFEDPDPSVEPMAPKLSQEDVYKRVVVPMLPALCEGYSLFFGAYGASDSGKMATMFGDNNSHRGLFYRLSDDLYGTMRKQLRPNATFTVELECVEMANETYVDLLSSKRVAADLKVREDPIEGVVLQGVTRLQVDTPNALTSAVEHATRGMYKRKSTFAVTIRIVETYIFRDPEIPEAPQTSKSRRMNITFAVLRAMPSAFYRCIDTAIERDSGNPLMKPPTRDSVFTKLFSDVFLQGVNVTFITCVSPFFKDSKEALASLAFAQKIESIRTSPRLNHDTAMMEMRRLADEMKNLDEVVVLANQSIEVVQGELDKRQIELEEAERVHRDVSRVYANARKVANAFQQFKQRETVKFRSEQKVQNQEMGALQKEIDAIESQTKNACETIERVRTQRIEVEDHIRKLDDEIDKQRATNKVFEDELEIYTNDKKEVDDMANYIKMKPADREAHVAALVKQSVLLKKETPKQRAEAVAARENEKESLEKMETAESRVKVYREQKDAISKKREMIEQMKKDIKLTEEEIQRMENETKRMEEEMKNAPKGCCMIM